MQSLGDGVQHSLDGVQHSVDVALTEEDRKKLRLQRNREIARNCRKRQREKMEQMEQEVKRLREENDELVFLLRKGVDSKNREKERCRQLKKLREMKDTASEEEVSDRKGCDGVAQKPNGAVHRELARLRPGASSHCKISFRPLKVPLASHQCRGRPGS